MAGLLAQCRPEGPGGCLINVTPLRRDRQGRSTRTHPVTYRHRGEVVAVWDFTIELY